MEEFRTFVVDNVLFPIFKYVLYPLYVYWQENGLTNKVISYAFAFQAASAMYLGVRQLLKFKVGLAIQVFFMGMFDPRSSIIFVKDIFKFLRWLTLKVISLVRWIYRKITNKEESSVVEDFLS